MPDQLNLSLRVRGFSAATMLERFQTLLSLFPFSRQRPGIAALRVYAVEFAEPPLIEHGFTAEADVDAVIEACREFENADCSYTVDGWWDLFRFDRDWQLMPVRVSLICFGPEFDNQEQDHLRIEFGAVEDFLPDPALPDAQRKAQSNLASLVRLARDIRRALPLEQKGLWTESGEDLAERLDEVLD